MLTITQTLQSQTEIAATKTESIRRPVKFLIAGIFGGAYMGVGVVFMLSAAGPLSAAGSGSSKLVAGIVFSVALTLVVFAGADLVTSAMMYLTQGIAAHSVRPLPALGTLCAMFVANFCGAFLFALLIMTTGLIEPGSPARTLLTNNLADKSSLTPAELFTRGILCNVLVCLAVWMSNRIENEVAKIACIFAAISAFVASGFEHVVANMATYSIGFLLQEPTATLSIFTGNMLWVGLGNFVGGGLIVGVGYWLLAVSKQPLRKGETSANVRETS